MTKQRNNFARLTLWSLALSLMLCATPTSFRAQGDKPSVVVSMYFVGEKVACPPDGYGESETETLRRCKRLTFKDLDTMTRQRIVTPVQQGIPPEQLRLGKTLLDSIDAFSDDCTIKAPCMNKPERRYSIILAFEVKGASDFDGNKIEIRRILPKGNKFDPYSKSGKLSEQGRWINHQRADIFLPSHRVRWELKLGQWSWNLGTEQ